MLIKGCKISYTCIKFSKQHQVSICDEIIPNENPTSDPLNLAAADFTHNNFCENSNTILLQTATAKILNPTNNLSENVRMLFDTGSQLKYISKFLKLKLKLPVLGTESLVIQVFGKGEDSAVSKVDIAKLKFY